MTFKHTTILYDYFVHFESTFVCESFQLKLNKAKDGFDSIKMIERKIQWLLYRKKKIQIP